MIKKLFYSPISPPSRAVKLIMEAIALKDVQTEELNILTKDYLRSDIVKVNPQHTVPTLVDQNHIVWDSHAIAAYLVQKYSKQDYLYPKNLAERSLVDQRLHFDSGVLYPTLHNAVYPILFCNKSGILQSDRSAIKKAYKLMDTFLDKSPWLCGNYMTIADLCCLATVSTLDYVLPITESSFPRLHSFLQRCQRLPYYEQCNQAGIEQLGSILQEKILIARATGRCAI